ATLILFISWTSHTLVKIGWTCRQRHCKKWKIFSAAFPSYRLSTPTFIGHLVECVGMYEPKTFTFLTAIVRRNRQVASLAALGDGQKPEGIFS
uniref:Uncharacterized protein n=1 Tax=Strigops habroptila TaxID=2489341 RepID=A0A672UQQ2_STRHB